MTLNAEAAKWVEDKLSSMTIEQKVGQILLPILSEGMAAPLSASQWVNKYHFGGGHLFGGDAEYLRNFVDQVQADAEIPLLMSGDLDKGGERITEGTVFQCQMALGAADDEQLAYELGKAIAIENLAVGYNWTFSPIVDILGHVDHQRHIASIGEDAEQVIRLTCAQIRGLQDSGMAACAKHFPGDGFDDRDQHLTTTVNPLSSEDWYATSGRAFKEAIDAGVWTIMNAHIAAPNVDKEVTDHKFPTPAITSRYMTEGILRDEFGFDGVIVTDALNMGGIAHHYPQPERYVRAFEAGNDMLLFVTRMDQTVEYILNCVKSGRITTERLDTSVRRILTLKARLGLHKGTSLAEKPTPEFFTESPCKAQAKRLAESSITMLRDSKNVIPVNPAESKNIAHVLFTNREDEFMAEVFEKTLTDAGCDIKKFLNPLTEVIYDEIAGGNYDIVITSFYYPPQWGWNTIKCHGQSIRGIMSGYYLADPDVKPVFISFDTPSHLYEMAFMDPYLCSYGTCDAAQIALAQAILGEIPIKGKVPISFKGIFERGDGIIRE